LIFANQSSGEGRPTSAFSERPNNVVGCISR
jgi:hypothetical protein